MPQSPSENPERYTRKIPFLFYFFLLRLPLPFIKLPVHYFQFHIKKTSLSLWLTISSQSSSHLLPFFFGYTLPICQLMLHFVCAAAAYKIDNFLLKCAENFVDVEGNIRTKHVYLVFYCYFYFFYNKQHFFLKFCCIVGGESFYRRK